MLMMKGVLTAVLMGVLTDMCMAVCLVTSTCLRMRTNKYVWPRG